MLGEEYLDEKKHKDLEISNLFGSPVGFKPSRRRLRRQFREGCCPKPIKLGLLSISAAILLLWEYRKRDTLKMMAEQLNAKGGINGHPVELEILDNKSTEQEAVTAVKGLIDKGVLAVIGGSSSGTSMAMISSVQNAKIPMISLAAASSIVEPVTERQWVFKTPQSDIVMISKIIDYLQSNNLQKVAFMSMNNSYGDGGKKVFDAAAKENNLTIVTEEKFDAADKDMTPQLSKIKGSGAQAVIVWAIPPSASILTKNFKDMGLTIPLIHSHGVGNQSFIDLAQGAADGVILPIGKLTVADQIAADDPQKKVLDSYITEFQQEEI